MKSKIVSIMLFFLMFFAVFISAFPYVSSSNNEIYVDVSHFGSSDGTADRPYKSIQEAIGNAEPGDTIWVFGGLYEENLVINKKVKIQGSIEGTETIIEPPLSTNRYLIEITADEVTLESVTVSDTSPRYIDSTIGALICVRSSNNRINKNKVLCTQTNGIFIDSDSNDNLINGNLINDTRVGIWVKSAKTNDITNNVIKNSTENGIEIESSNENNLLYGNKIENSTKSGLKIRDSNNCIINHNTITNSKYYGLHVLNCLEINITSNEIKQNPDGGLYLSSSSNVVVNNTFIDNSRSITVIGDKNIIEKNVFRSSTSSAIYCEPSANDNTITQNDFKGNTVSAIDRGNNNWYLDKKGNYWSDYDNVDILPENNKDGIGDEPYTKNGVYDKYPLGYFLRPPKRPSDPDPEDNETGVRLEVTLKVHIEDPDSDRLTVSFYRAEDNSLINSQTLNPVKNVVNNSIAECRFNLGFGVNHFEWYAVADDGILQNQSRYFHFSTIEAPPDNIPPVAVTGGPYSGEAKDEIQFYGSSSYDPDGEIEFFRWNFGDGSSEILKENPTHEFKSEGTYNITLTVVDDNGSSDTDITTITVGKSTNLPPVAIIDASSTAYTGNSVKFESKSFDPDNDELNYTWDFPNDVTYYDKVVYHTFDSPAEEYHIELTVFDGDKSDVTFFKIKIENEPVEETPGFEIIIFLVSLLFVTLVLVKKKKIN